ncbi:MAG: TlpA family protein disulfide reductase [Longimicrobiales bacterium]
MNWGRSVVAVAVSVPLLLLLWFGMGRDPRRVPSTLPGRVAPAFALEIMDSGPSGSGNGGDTVRLAGHGGDVVVINYWASWCAECRYEHRPLSDAALAYRERPVRFYGILYNDTPEKARAWIEAMGGQTYPTLLDPGGRTAIEYGLTGVPETFFIGADGRVAHHQWGPVSARLIVSIVDSLLVERRNAVGGRPAGPASGLSEAQR